VLACFENDRLLIFTLLIAISKNNIFDLNILRPQDVRSESFQPQDLLIAIFSNRKIIDLYLSCNNISELNKFQQHNLLSHNNFPNLRGGGGWVGWGEGAARPNIRAS